MKAKVLLTALLSDGACRLHASRQAKGSAAAARRRSRPPLRRPRPRLRLRSPSRRRASNCPSHSPWILRPSSLKPLRGNRNRSHNPTAPSRSRRTTPAATPPPAAAPPPEPPRETFREMVSPAEAKRLLDQAANRRREANQILDQLSKRSTLTPAQRNVMATIRNFLAAFRRSRKAQRSAPGRFLRRARPDPRQGIAE